jgi:hypothetical protein
MNEAMYTNSNDVNHQGGMIIKAGVETGEVVKKFLIFNDYIF